MLNCTNTLLTVYSILPITTNCRFMGRHKSYHMAPEAHQEVPPYHGVALSSEQYQSSREHLKAFTLTLTTVHLLKCSQQHYPHSDGLGQIHQYSLLLWHWQARIQWFKQQQYPLQVPSQHSHHSWKLTLPTLWPTKHWSSQKLISNGSCCRHGDNPVVVITAGHHWVNSCSQQPMIDHDPPCGGHLTATHISK